MALKKMIVPKKKYSIDILGSKNSEYYWTITHKNGNIIAKSSETYINKKDCRAALTRLMDAIMEGDIQFMNYTDPDIQ